MSHKHHYYNNNWKQNNDNNVEEPNPTETNAIIDTISEPEVEEAPTVIRGTVTACTKLNVRKMPKAGSDVVCVLDINSEVVIDEERSTEEFYRVTTASGREGFCMKKYISIQ